MTHPRTLHPKLDAWHEATDGLSTDQQARFDRRLIGALADTVDADLWTEALRVAGRGAS